MNIVTSHAQEAPKKNDGTYYINVNEKGRMTLPARLRKVLDVDGESKIVVNVRNGHVAIEGRLPTVAETAGIVPALASPKSEQEIEEIIQDEVAERYLEKSKQW